MAQSWSAGTAEGSKLKIVPNRPSPLFANESNATALFDLKRTEFLTLVDAGALPPGKEIVPGLVRWVVAELEAIGNDCAALPEEDIEL